jgi:ParB-like chromosome segregation protein Spo0J
MSNDPQASDNALKNLVVQQIPLHLIRPNPDNRLVTPDMVEDMAASLAAVGLKNAVKMRPLPDGTFDLFSGHVRLAGAQKLGWVTIAAYVMDITPEEAVEIGIRDNRQKAQTWLDDYRDIEALERINPQITIPELGVRLDMGETNVKRGQRLLRCLNQASRDRINQSITQSRAAKAKISRVPTDSAKVWELAEAAVYALAPLKDQERVLNALIVVIDRQMTAPEASKLVEWVEAGNPPETYTGQNGTKTPTKKAPTVPQEVADKLVELSEKVGFAKGRGEDPAPAQNELKAYRDSLTVTKSSGQELSHPITSPVGFAKLKQLIGDTVKKLKSISNNEQEAGNSSAPAHAGQTPHHTATSPDSGISTHMGSQQVKKEMKPIARWFKKFGEKAAKFPLVKISKAEHQICRKLAHAIMPTHSASHSSGSGRSHSRGQLKQQLANLFLTVLHWVVYVLLQYGGLWVIATILICPFIPVLKPVIEWPFRFTAHWMLFSFPPWVWACAQTHLGPTLVIGGVLGLGFYFAWKAEKLRLSLVGIALLYLVVQGREWSTNADMALAQPNPAPQLAASAQVPTTVAQTKTETIISKIISHSSPAPKKISTPVVTYQPSIAFNTTTSPSDASPVSTLYDPKLLEQEIAAVPNNAIITAFPISPDEGIPGDLAVTRLQDTMDTDKYTLWIGGGQYKISGITATTTNLIINCKSTDTIGSFFNGGGMTPTLIWEDMLYIHTDEIDIPGKIPQKFFHCTLVGEGAKNAITFRCNSADDLKHLVSALEYFIRNSRLGHDTALAGTPYPSQGVRLDNHWIVKLWAGSPMDRAGVHLNDLVWSMDKDTQSPQDDNKLKNRLNALTSGAYPLFIYSPPASDNIGVDQNEFHAGNFSPKRQKVSLAL